jgi:hypothetical protein
MSHPAGLQVLWGIFLDHITEVMRSSAAHVRNAAIDALEKVVTGALGPGRRQGPGAGPPSLASSRQPSMSPSKPAALERQSSSASGPSREQEDAVENMVLVALESFYREEHAEEQVRLGVLRIVQQALQHHGEQLSRGWVAILRLLGNVARGEEAKTVSAGFSCVELICSDLLSALPKEYLSRSLELIELYGSQKAVINKSLTAINLLWNATDFIARSTGGSTGSGSREADSRALQHQQSMGSGPDGERGGGGDDGAAEARSDLTDKECLDLMMQVGAGWVQVQAQGCAPQVPLLAVRASLLMWGHASGSKPQAAAALQLVGPAFAGAAYLHSCIWPLPSPPSHLQHLLTALLLPCCRCSACSGCCLWTSGPRCATAAAGPCSWPWARMHAGPSPPRSRTASTR